MNTTFYKYQGTGNDFVMIDDRTGQFPISQDLIASLCHRRYGIGADGLILLQNADGYDFRMVYFNADGTESTMCGNGGRCLVRFAYDLGIFKQTTNFIAIDGPHEATVKGELVSLKMSPVSSIEMKADHDFLNTGSPHYVTYVDDIESTTVFETGRAVRYGAEYGPQGGTNVNFVQVLDTNRLNVRTYERGVEDETYSCGTGVTASVLSASLHQNWEGPVSVETLGGTLQVSYRKVSDQQFDDIFLIGPAKFVFKGETTVA
jgi:diaminopimelate epimerase